MLSVLSGTITTFSLSTVLPVIYLMYLPDIVIFFEAAIAFLYASPLSFLNIKLHYSIVLYIGKMCSENTRELCFALVEFIS